MMYETWSRSLLKDDKGLILSIVTFIILLAKITLHCTKTVLSFLFFLGLAKYVLKYFQILIGFGPSGFRKYISYKER